MISVTTEMQNSDSSRKPDDSINTNNVVSFALQ